MPKLSQFGELKRKFFPTIKDFSKEYPEYKHCGDVFKLPDLVFVFFTMKGTRFTFYPSAIIATILISFLTILAFKRNIVLGFVVLYILFVVVKMIVQTHKSIANNMSLYDLFIKEVR